MKRCERASVEMRSGVKVATRTKSPTKLAPAPHRQRSARMNSSIRKRISRSEFGAKRTCEFSRLRKIGVGDLFYLECRKTGSVPVCRRSESRHDLWTWEVSVMCVVAGRRSIGRNHKQLALLSSSIRKDRTDIVP